MTRRRLLWTTFLLATGCVGPTPPRDLVFRTLDRGPVSGIKDPRRLVIRDEVTWFKFWVEHAQDLPDVGLPPSVDFNSDMVIALTMGRRPTGGYFIEVVLIDVQGHSLRVLVSEHKPAKDTLQTQAETAPFQYVAIPASEASVYFRRARPRK